MPGAERDIARWRRSDYCAVQETGENQHDMRSLVRLAITAILFVLFALHSGAWLRWGLLDRIETFTYDARVRLSAVSAPDRRVVIVDLDEKSLAAEGQWPWPRDTLARLVDRLFEDYRVRALGFDIAFPEPDAQSPAVALARLQDSALGRLPGFAEASSEVARTLDPDRRFAQALRDRPVVMGYVFKQFVPEGEAPAQAALGPALFEDASAVDYVEPRGYTGNLAVLQAAAASGGFFDNPLVDGDGVYRRVPLLQRYQGAVYPSLALALTRAALGDAPVALRFDPPQRQSSLYLEAVQLGALRIPVDGEVAAWVPYRGAYRSFPYVSASEVLRGRADPEVLAGAIVLVGTTAPGLLDFRVTPVAHVFPGVEIHANLVSGILDGRIKQRPSWYLGLEVSEMALIALLFGLLFPRLSPLAGAALAAALAGLVVVAALLAWRGGFILPVGVPVVFMLFLFLAQQLYGYFIESRGKREISRLFGQYVPPELVEEMAARPQAVSMDGDIREMTVLFSDVRGFTSISERLDARSLSDMMNQFLTPQTRCIQQYRGTIDKYMGDAIMAFWGAPLPDAGHALNAVRAALAMIRAVESLNPQFVARGWPPIRVGIGISSGPMRVGNMGSEFRVAYTVMGDPVNLASRVEGLTKAYGAAIIVTESTRRALPADWALRELDRVRVKGKEEPVTIYEPLGPKDELDAAVREALARHRGALRAYRGRRWDEAELTWSGLAAREPDRRLYGLYLERIARLRAEAPPADWDGVFVFETK